MKTFLIDQISNNGLLAFTTDDRKVRFNLSLIPDIAESISQTIVKSRHGGSKFVFPVGPYIVVYQGSIHMTSQSMFFFHYTVDPMHAHLVHSDLFSENVIGEFNRCASLMEQGFISTDEEIRFSDLANPTESYN